ncbi:hypothetical protein BHM03_00045703 [Ensete ventricosum]|nr:hypothetical protein BHM03_00045703 [Ensete ventricosum]
MEVRFHAAIRLPDERYVPPLFADGGRLFLEPCIPDSAVAMPVRLCRFCGKPAPLGGIRWGGGVGDCFLSVSLSVKGSEGFVRESAGVLGKQVRRSEEAAWEGKDDGVMVVLEEHEKNRIKNEIMNGRVQGVGAGAMNTTKHLWAGAVAAMVSRFIAGAAAGITATILCIPMDTIRTKMVAPGGEALGGVIGVFRHMVETEGLFSLYKGLVPSLISMAPSGAVFYGMYDILKTAYLRSPEGRNRLALMKQRQGEEVNALDQLELGPVRTLLYGAIAGACAEAATYPFEVVRRHLQMQVQANRLNAFATFMNIVDKGGAPAVYAGMIPSLLQVSFLSQVLPSASISYFVYEFMKIVLKVE